MTFKRHLLLAALIGLAALAVLAVRNRDTLATMVENAAALDEGAEAAAAIRSPDDLLAYFADHPERVSLAVRTLPGGEAGPGPNGEAAHRADVRRPLAGIARLQLLAGYGEAVAAGRLSPDRRVPADSVGLYALPGATAAAHARHVDRLRAAGRLAGGGARVADWVEGAVRHGDDAAADWLMVELGAAWTAGLPARLGLAASDAPVPTAGRALAWMGHAPAATGPADTAFALARRLRADPAFRERIRAALTERGSGLDLPAQRAWAQRTAPRGTAADYVRLLERLAAEGAAVRGLLEQVVPAGAAAGPFAHLAVSSGMRPGLLAFAGYARRTEGRPPRALVLLAEDVPLAVAYHLVQTGIDTGLQLRLLAEERYAQRAGRRLARAGAPAHAGEASATGKQARPVR